MNWDLVGIASAVSVAVLGYLAHRRSKTVDAVSAQSGVAANGRAGTAQIIEGLKVLVEALQVDNDNFRDDIRTLVTRCDAVTAERDALRLEVARLRKRYGVNGENGPKV